MTKMETVSQSLVVLAVKRHYVAIAPDGTKFTRCTECAARTFSHAVLVWCQSWRDRAWKWRSHGFAGSVEQAAKSAVSRQKHLQTGERIEVVEVHEFTPLTERQREFLDQIGDRTLEMFHTSHLVPLVKRGLVERCFIGQRWWRVRRTEAGRRALEGAVP